MRKSALIGAITAALGVFGFSPSTRMKEQVEKARFVHRARYYIVSTKRERSSKFPKTPHKHSRAKARKRARCKVRMRGHRHG